MNADRLWERALKAWKTWARPRHERHRGCLAQVPAHADAKGEESDPGEQQPCQTIRPTNRRVSRDSCGSRGGRFITPGADGSSASAKVG